jgi:hypothetical protein
MPLPHRRPPRLGVTPLEDRTVPAVGGLYISEVHFDPLFGDQNTQQYIELRGRPDAAVAPGTYFVALDGDDGAAGVANAVFDLGGLALGSDGYLVITQGGSDYEYRPGATVLRAQGDEGFAGLGNRFAGSATIGSNLEFIFGANTFLLVESPTRPTPNTDYDANDDGILDGAAARWTVLDSVGVLGTFVGGDADQIGYGQINFAVGGLGRVPEGSTLVEALDFGYVARVGESTGYAPADWVAAQTVETAAGSGVFRLESSLFGFPTVGYLAGRALDHLGTANFVASAGGTKFADANGNGVRDPGEGGQPGATLWADRNGNGVRDSFTTVVEPDDFGSGEELTNAVNGVTLTEEGHLGGSIIFGRGVAASDEARGNTSTGTRAFGRNGINWFDEGSRLRMDFYRPVQSISIDFIAGGLVDYFGRLDAFAADGTLLSTFRSNGIRDSVTTLTINRPAADIAYATAYSDGAGSPFGLFDNLRFTRPEDTAVSGPDGAYRVDGLQDGTYRIREVRRAGSSQTFPASPGFYDATVADGVPVRGLDFGNVTGGGTNLTGNPVLAAGGTGGQAVAFRSAGDGRLDPTPTALPLIPLADAPFTGVLRSASADVDGDGVPDFVVVTGPGTAARFAVVDGVDGLTLLVPPTPVFAGSEGFDGGAFVAAGDIDGDGRAELVFTPDQGGGPRVTVFSALPTGLAVRANFLGIADANFRGGARPAVGDVNGDGKADLLVAAGVGGGPRVALFNGATLFTTRTRLVSDFFAFDPSLRDGVFAAIGDVNGDGRGDLVFGAGSGGAPRLFVVSGRTLLSDGVRAALAAPIANFFVGGDTAGRGGARVAVLDVDGDRRADVAVGSGGGEAGRVRVYRGADLVAADGEPEAVQDVFPFGTDPLAGGVFVG